jgi:hypothetical protein
VAVTVDQATLGTGNASASTTTTLTTTNAVAAGARILIVCGRFYSGANTQSFTTTGGLTWTQDHTVVSGSIRTSVWSAAAPSGLASSTALTITHTNACDSIMGGASYNGIDTSGFAVAFNGAAASTAAWSSGSVAGNAGDALIGGAFVDNGSVSSSVIGGSETERIDKNVAGQSETLTLYDILSIAGSTALTGTWNAAGSHVATAVAYKALAAATIPQLVMAPPIPT